ncbi:hypothetical protein LX81_00268 [Palleronia aestuarii]|uniref:Uncharacterized protein n=1 Tax=Palleronia aestuarii TaxID=568105 RepID=A0A2W7P302_9RHOB|nr:hypothetical protein [Palleronia aestuarii]PZX19806.1 hypothetical protein LX81_00268 [Palleronia aestuarii]
MHFDVSQYEDVYNGSASRKAYAGMILALWFALGGFVCSVIGDFVPVLSSVFVNIIGGVVAVLVAMALKLVSRKRPE